MWKKNRLNVVLTQKKRPFLPKWMKIKGKKNDEKKRAVQPPMNGFAFAHDTTVHTHTKRWWLAFLRSQKIASLFGTDVRATNVPCINEKIENVFVITHNFYTKLLCTSHNISGVRREKKCFFFTRLTQQFSPSISVSSVFNYSLSAEGEKKRDLYLEIVDLVRFRSNAHFVLAPKWEKLSKQISIFFSNTIQPECKCQMFNLSFGSALSIPLA